MTHSPQINEVLALALKLSPKERMRLIEEVASSVEREIDAAPNEQQPLEHWGKKLIRLVAELDMTNWTNIGIDDPVEWVKHVQREQIVHRGLNWEQDE
jgi:hypothetical protein